MTPYQVKRSLLYHAIQGELVSQDVREGTGKALIHENHKKILGLSSDIQKRVGKGCRPIKDGEFPFKIPESWEWERFGNLVINYDSQRKPVTKSDRKTSKGLYDYYGATGAIDKVDEYIFDGEYLMIGEDGGNFFVDRDNSFIARGTFWANNHVHVVQPIVCDISFLKICLDTFDLPNMGLINGIAVPKLNQENMNSILIPVPPLAEQKRIVAKIEELMPLVDRYEKAWNQLKELNKRFPEDMQKALLQWAIQGKLVEQRPEEGTGEELYQQIQAEKQALIKAGKIKKEKLLPEITEDEVPFEIPETWKWYRIGEVFNIINGFTPLKSNSDFWTDGDIPWFTIDDVHRQGRFISYTEKAISRKALSKNTERIVPSDSVLLCCTASVGEYAYTRIPLTTNQQFNAFVTKPEFISAIYPMYVFEFAKTLKDTLIRKAGKTTFNFLSVGKLSNLLIPLPPLSEQKRIVAKLEELLPLCERLR